MQGCRDGLYSHLEALALWMCSYSRRILGCHSQSISRSGAGTAQVPSPGSAGCSRDLVLPPAKSLWLDAGSSYCQVISFPPLSIELVYYLLSYPSAGLGAEHPSLVLAVSAGEKMEFAKAPDLILWERTASCGQVPMGIQVRVSRCICGPVGTWSGNGNSAQGPCTGASFGNGTTEILSCILP